MSSGKPIIGVLTWDFARPNGGMGRVMQQFAHIIKDGGHDVRVASPQTDCPFLGFTQNVGRHVLFSLLLPFTLKRWINKNQVTRLLMPVGPGGVFLLRNPGVPMTGISYHTYRQQASAVPGEWWKRIFIPLERLTLRRCAKVLCYAEDTRRVLIEAYGLPENVVQMCPQPLNFIPMKENRMSGLCVCVARLDTRKGIGVLIDAWKKLKTPGAHLVIVGEGRMQADVDQLIAESKGSVVQLKSCSADELTTLLAAAELVICPAYLEGFGLAAAEGMAAGSCVIASDCDGLRSIVIDKQTGLSFPPGDAAALAAAVDHAFAHTEEREQLGAAARAFIQKHCDETAARTALLAAVA